jgi:hypothetical protein
LKQKKTGVVARLTLMKQEIRHNKITLEKQTFPVNHKRSVIAI